MKLTKEELEKLSPMMKQYLEIKKDHEDELLFYRIGDFYELFFDDGITASRELELTLTGKNGGLKERIPMCGVPFHSVSPYIEKLVNKGYKVAICEQLEDPRKTKGMVKRGVTQVLSKGTIADLELLNEHDNHYIASIIDFSYIYAICYADISTGNIYASIITHNKEKLISTILNLGVLEVVLEDNSNTDLITTLKNHYNIEVSIYNSKETNGLNLYENIEEEHLKEASKTLLNYLVEKELKDIASFKDVEIVYQDEYLEMDIHTVRNLELVETLRQKERTNSLIWLLDKTKTSMGSRKLKFWLMNPLKDKDLITRRYDMIEKLNTEFILKDKLREELFNVYDIERLCGKLVNGQFNARDMLQLKNSLKVLPEIKDIINKLGFNYELNTHKEIYDLLEESIYEEPPITLKEGYLIKTGYNKELDELKDIRSGGKKFIASFESKLKEETGIQNLKVGYNKVFGYFIEVTKGQISKVSEDLKWERRQTLTGAERFISPELKEKESLILNAEEKIIDIEYELFNNIKETVKKDILSLKDTANVLAEVDAITSLAVDADTYHLKRPELNNNHELQIKNGRHPVVEYVSNMEYVSNDCIMDPSINTLLITGPNMSGKSTFMRQLAIIIIMAQMGSFVPADDAKLPIIDKIFTRIGASDDLVSGESTFMVEMKEARNALVNATENSLILFDELGRGTATYDGMSLAEAILRYVTENIRCKTLFSTHYHELTELEKELPSIKNVHVSAQEENGTLTFLHKVKNGSIDKSYGIHVAKLAGMPESVIKDADKILAKYESMPKKKKEENQIQLAMNFEEPKESSIEKEISELDPLRMTPLEALETLYKLKEKINNK